MELYQDVSLWTLCADKYRMREYVAKKGLSQYLPKLLAVWRRPEDIDFSNLDSRFAIKLNNGCGDCYIVKDKNKVNIECIKEYFRRQLKIHIGYDNSQRHYLNIKPCIIAEELLEQDSIYKEISPNSLIDFKFWAFRGNVESCFVTYNRKGHHFYLDLKNIEWQSMPNYLVPNNMIKYNPSIDIPKPKCYEEMLHIVSLLSEDFPEVRIDLYSINGRPMIGEMTFSTGYGYFTHEYYQILGNKIIL